MENEKTQDSLVSLPPQWQAWWQWQAQEGVWVLTKPYTNHSQPTQPKYNLTRIQKLFQTSDPARKGQISVCFC